MAGDSAGLLDRLVASTGNVLATLITRGRTRLELLTVEIQEELQRSATLLLWAGVALLAGGWALFFAGLTVVFVFWETHRLLAAVLVTGSFAALALTAVLVLRSRLANRPRFLGATLSELRTDAGQLSAGNRDVVP